MEHLMYIPNKKHNLTENQVERFVDSCPDNVDEREFMALVCVMADLYGFKESTIRHMFSTLIEAIDFNHVTFVDKQKKITKH